MTKRPASQATEYRAAVFARWGHVCWLCRHPGAQQIDHVESVTEHPELEWSVSNGRPAHGAPGNRCSVCRQNCNQLRGGYSPERARRLIAERSGLEIEPEPPRDTGREW